MRIVPPGTNEAEIVHSEPAARSSDWPFLWLWSTNPTSFFSMDPRGKPAGLVREHPQSFFTPRRRRLLAYGRRQGYRGRRGQDKRCPLVLPAGNASIPCRMQIFAGLRLLHIQPLAELRPSSGFSVSARSTSASLRPAPLPRVVGFRQRAPAESLPKPG